jgi:hypothetical protein
MNKMERDKEHMDNFIDMANLLSRLINEMESDGIQVVDGCITQNLKEIQVHAGIEYLANLAGANTWEKHLPSINRTKKCFKYKGWTFLQLNETAPDGTIYYR